MQSRVVFEGLLILNPSSSFKFTRSGLLAAVGVWPAVGHGQHAALAVLQVGVLKDLVRKLAVGRRVDALATLAGACAICMHPSLCWVVPWRMAQRTTRATQSKRSVEIGDLWGRRPGS